MSAAPSRRCCWGAPGVSQGGIQACRRTPSGSWRIFALVVPESNHVWLPSPLVVRANHFHNVTCSLPGSRCHFLLCLMTRSFSSLRWWHNLRVPLLALLLFCCLTNSTFATRRFFWQDAWRRCQTPASIKLGDLGEEEWEVIRDTEDEQARVVCMCHGRTPSGRCRSVSVWMWRLEYLYRCVP